MCCCRLACVGLCVSGFFSLLLLLSPRFFPMQYRSHRKPNACFYFTFLVLSSSPFTSISNHSLYFILGFVLILIRVRCEVFAGHMKCLYNTNIYLGFISIVFLLFRWKSYENYWQFKWKIWREKCIRTRIRMAWIS